MGAHSRRHSSGMTLRARFALPAFALFTVVSACAGKTETSTSTVEPSVVPEEDAGSGPAPEPTCTGKACGVDCTPAGSDEPFNCNAAGQCVATGAPLGCEPTSCVGKICGQDCSPPDSDEPFNCDAAGKCVVNGTGGACGPATSPECAGKVCGQDCSPAGSEEPFFCDPKGACVGTGTPVTCGSPCPEFLGDCPAGTKPVDSDGDTCIDACK